MKGGPDGSSARMMKGEITFSQVWRHLIDPLEKVFCNYTPISPADHKLREGRAVSASPVYPL